MSIARHLAVALLALGALGAGAGCAGLIGPRRPQVEFTPYPEAQVAAVRNPHDYQGKPLCQRCHLPGDGRLASGAISLCVSCHAFGHANHPVDVVQKTPAGDLPLLAGGKVACHTCHDPHDLKRHRAGLRLGFSELCLRCHQGHQ
jgi:predicted CXXCH cytochrome family protein